VLRKVGYNKNIKRRSSTKGNVM